MPRITERNLMQGIQGRILHVSACEIFGSIRVFLCLANFSNGLNIATDQKKFWDELREERKFDQSIFQLTQASTLDDLQRILPTLRLITCKMSKKSDALQTSLAIPVNFPLFIFDSSIKSKKKLAKKNRNLQSERLSLKMLLE